MHYCHPQGLLEWKKENFISLTHMQFLTDLALVSLKFSYQNICCALDMCYNARYFALY